MVLNGAPVAEVELRYGASHQSIYNWRARYEQDGQPGLLSEPLRPPAATSF